MSKTNNKCPICKSTSTTQFLEIKQVPIYCNILLSNHEEAKHVARNDIILKFCTYCGHIFNSAFNPNHMNYNNDYENALHFSPRFQKYNKVLIKYLIKTYNLNNKNIIDIGCGKGHFLTLLCKQGNNRGIGFDPSCSNKQTKNSTKQVTFVKDFYSEKFSNCKTDFICCRQVLEHIQHPHELLAIIHNAIINKKNTAVFFEVPNTKFMLKNLSIWDLIYEHYSYFSKSSFHYLFTSSGYQVCNLTETFGNQYLCIEAKPTKKKIKINYEKEIEQISRDIEVFAEKYQTKVKTWQQNLKKIKQSNKKVVVWGAGTKGIMFLNILKVKKQIKYVVDINPHKQGKWIAGTGQRVVAPEFLKEYKPDIIIVMNKIYKNEIKQITKDLGISIKFLYA